MNVLHDRTSSLVQLAADVRIRIELTGPLWVAFLGRLGDVARRFVLNSCRSTVRLQLWWDVFDVFSLLVILILNF